MTPNEKEYSKMEAKKISKLDKLKNSFFLSRIKENEGLK